MTKPKIARDASSLRRSREALNEPSQAGKRAGATAGSTNVLSPRKPKGKGRARYSVPAGGEAALAGACRQLSSLSTPLPVNHLIELLIIQTRRSPAFKDRFLNFFHGKEGSGITLYSGAKETSVWMALEPVDWLTKDTKASVSKSVSFLLLWAVEDLDWIVENLVFKSPEVQSKLPF